MNIYKLKTQAAIKGIARVDEYLKLLNFAVEDYNQAILVEAKQIKYEVLKKAYEEYLTCNSQTLQTFRALHESHNEEQQRNK